MNDEKAKIALQKYLGPSYVILDMIREDYDCFQFRVKKKEKLNKTNILPSIFGVDKNTGEILTFADILIRIEG